MAEAQTEAQAKDAPTGGLTSRVLTVMFWGNLLLIFGIFFAQINIRIPTTDVVLHKAWDPPQNAYTVAFVTATGMLCALWYIDRWFGLGGPRGLIRWLVGLSLFALFVSIDSYFYIVSEEISFRPAFGSIPDMLLGTLMLALSAFLTWRAWGLTFPILAMLFFGYLFFADLLPGEFRGPPVESQEVV